MPRIHLADPPAALMIWLPWDEWVRAYEQAHETLRVDNGHGTEAHDYVPMQFEGTRWYTELISLEDE